VFVESSLVGKTFFIEYIIGIVVKVYFPEIVGVQATGGSVVFQTGSEMPSFGSRGPVLIMGA